MGIDIFHKSDIYKMVRTKLITSVILLVLPISYTKVARFETCPPKPDTVSELSLDKYLGDWYTVSKIPAPVTSSMYGTYCVRARYGLTAPGSEHPISVQNTATTQDGEFTEFNGTAYIPDPNFPGELKVHFPSGDSPGIDGDYWLLDTDYDSYALIYSCQDVEIPGVGHMKFEFGWINSRTQIMDQDKVEELLVEIGNFGMDVSLWKFSYQGPDCVFEQE